MKNSFTLHRRALLLFAFATAAGPSFGAGSRPRIEVWKDPSCGCCKDWVVHLEKSGFEVTVNDSGNEQARQRLGIPQRLGSCHTASVGGYAVEGHVPAREIKRLLAARPQAFGLAVPGMPIGSPGMDGAIYKGRKDPFDVLLVANDGTSTVYQSYR
jgi:hypothetical protein